MDTINVPKAGRSLVPSATFARLTRRLTTEHPVDAHLAERIVDQAAAFLAACATAAQPLAPSRDVDLGWHAFLVHTRDYAEFCETVAGRFIHHVPHDNDREGGDEETQAVLDRSVEAIRRAGYIVDEELWRADTGTCSQCHNGCADDPPPNPKL